MVALANLYTILDVSIQQLAVGLAILPLLVALAWYVSHPAHRRQLLAASRRPGARARLRGSGSLAKALPPRTQPASQLPQKRGTAAEVIGRRVEA